MKNIIAKINCLTAVGALAWAATSCVAQTNSSVVLPPPGYRLAWADEFTGDALDTNKWNYRTDSKMWSTQLPANFLCAMANYFSP